MKKLLSLLFAICLFSSLTIAQSDQLDSATYDFWVGKWNANWENANGTKGSGTNHVFKVLDGTVIEENFSITGGPLVGFLDKSISVMDANKQWHQAWADNQGGYFDFTGEVIGEKKIFKTKLVEKDGKKIIQRMVFYDIKMDSFTWDWEGTQDGGETWNLLWRINYTRH
jgi:hypothetical protein